MFGLIALRNECAQVLHIFLPLIHMSEMSSILQSDPFDFSNIFKERLHCHILRLILDTIDQKCRSLNLVQNRNTRPITKGA